MLRESHFASVQNRKPDIFAEEGLDEHMQLASHNSHVAHCFDYLRQAIMCCGDMTLEWASADPMHIRTVDGWGIRHQCRDWKQAVEWTLSNKAPHNYSGIT